MNRASGGVSPEEIQFRLLVTLHGQYMREHAAPVIFLESALTTEDPSWNELERELLQLEYRGWIEFLSDLMPGTVMCRLTPEGREVFEALTEQITQQAAPLLGFDA